LIHGGKEGFEKGGGAQTEGASLRLMLTCDTRGKEEYGGPSRPEYVSCDSWREGGQGGGHITKVNAYM